MPKLCPICERSYADDNIFCPVDGATLRAEVQGDLVGSVIADRYLVTELLGEGGMGRVYLGRHIRLPLQVAIKVLRTDLVQDRASISRFTREATSASQIQSEFVARMVDFGETEDHVVYLAMEYVSGRTLRSLIQNEGPLALPRTAAIVSQIAEGLEAAHKLGIVHRDLKPDNVIITHDDELGDRAKVVDFGIAKAVGGDKDNKITSTGFIVGTPDFMSPEQVLDESIDARSDVYALGLVAYNMLTGVLPFSSTTPSKGLMARLVDDPMPLSKSNPRGVWTMQVQQVFDRVLSRDAGERYQTAREFAQALRESAGIAAPITSAHGDREDNLPSPAPREVVESVNSRTTRRTPLVAGLTVAAIATVALAMLLNNGTTAVNSSEDSAASQLALVDSTKEAVGIDSRALNSNSAPVGDRGSANPPSSHGSQSAATTAGTNSATVTNGTATAAASITASIDSIRGKVDSLNLLDDAAIPPAARTELARIDQLLPRSATAGDSARLHLLAANAWRTAGDDKAACGTLDKARKVAHTAADKRSVDRYHANWGCESAWRQP